MKKEYFVLLLLLFISPCFLWAQTSSTANSGGTGWKRIAVVQGEGGRGFGRVSLYTVGGSFEPMVLTVDWFHGWGSNVGISIRSDGKTSPLWSAARITDDGTNAYIEVNFLQQVAVLNILSDNYGWRPAIPYSGTLTNGGSTVMSTANVGKMNIENNFIITHNGSVGIGTINPTEKLAVNGTIRTKEIKVEAANWADYVFDDNYQMQSLAEVETFIRANKHLPGIPNAADVKENGVELGEMNRKLLEKVEELTLHLIKKDKVIGKQQDVLEEVLKRLKKLEEK